MIEAAEALAAEIEAEARQKADQIEAEERERVGAGSEQANAAEDRLEQANREVERIQSVLAGLRSPAAAEARLPRPLLTRNRRRSRQAVEETEETPQAEAAYDGSPEPEPEPAAAGGDPAGGEGEGARLIALNMALTGTPREETARYIEENFEVEDREALLDDVYSRAG